MNVPVCAKWLSFNLNIYLTKVHSVTLCNRQWTRQTYLMSTTVFSSLFIFYRLSNWVSERLWPTQGYLTQVAELSFSPGSSPLFCVVSHHTQTFTECNSSPLGMMKAELNLIRDHIVNNKYREATSNLPDILLRKLKGPRWGYRKNLDFNHRTTKSVFEKEEISMLSAYLDPF